MSDLEYAVTVGYYYFIVLGCIVLILALICFSLLAANRRLEQKINYLLGDDMEDFEKNRKEYKVYR